MSWWCRSRALVRETYTLTRRRQVHDYVRARASDGTTVRVPLRSGVTFGAVQSRGDRARQEDAISVACLMLPCDQLREHVSVHSTKSVARDPWHGWSCEEAGGADLGAQVVWFGCFDGHGGPAVAQLLKDKLHRVFEEADVSMITDTVRYTRSIGGYFGRYTGGILERWVAQDRLTKSKRASKKQTTSIPASSQIQAQAQAHANEQAQAPMQTANTLSTLSELASSSSSTTSIPELDHYVALRDDGGAQATHTERIAPPHNLDPATMTVEERATLACLMMDREVQQNEQYYGAGSTASILLVHGLDMPAKPWYSSESISLTTIHIGDTRFLLCPVDDGQAIPLTTLHHPEEPNEADRLSRLGAGIVTDSFGETRFLGSFANTRSFGDAFGKRYGVTAEPEVRTHLLRGGQFAFVIGFSDGISSVLSDQEIVDLCRDAKHPQQAAKNVLRFAEALGSDDNASVICVPLKGWGRIGGHDRTKAQRDKRRDGLDVFRTRRT
ncbi:Protein phosphatase 2C 6 [Malassezia pachydermatis]